MNKWIVGLMGMVILGGITEPCIGQVSVSATGESGFLRDYSSLQETKDSGGQAISGPG